MAHAGTNVTHIQKNKNNLPVWLPIGFSPQEHLCTTGTWPSLIAAPTDSLSEHIHHLFWECSMARWVWGLVFSSVSLSRFLPRSSLTAEGAPYGQGQWWIINIAKQVLWEARNMKVYQKTGIIVDIERKKQNLGKREVGGWTTGRNSLNSPPPTEGTQSLSGLKAGAKWTHYYFSWPFMGTFLVRF